jgi:prolipoprotein diacylglyceryltransferase
VWLGRRRAVRAPGLFALYVAGYSAFRILEELLRVDPAHHVLGLRLNFFVAGTLTAAGLLWFWRIQRHDRHADQAAQPAPLASTTGSATRPRPRQPRRMRRRSSTSEA